MSALKKTSMILLLVMSVFATTFASMSSAAAQGTSMDKPPAGGPRRQLGTIIYAGLGGAVLGLSTLSFYGRPQDKLANIAIGFAVGVISGTIAVTYNAATNPDDFYGMDNRSAESFVAEERETFLGPASSMAALENKRVDDFASTLSASFEVFKF